MGRNLPALTPLQRKNAPWNESPGIEAYFPQVCGICDFKAEYPAEISEHNQSADHDAAWSRR